ncbi:type II secretion system protein GspD [Oleomonas cavernae]|uniref:Type II secretion system protein GspD n=1 Tax=Oleomonas cavernae TaxID=2320859 RepID=A0A418WD67_9PROT|nr:type II secretion system secretin GspD [Oleomonas cavernae]RJF87944.1 type II secretion system protein GspD [Oleomonas cavernae]
MKSIALRRLTAALVLLLLAGCETASDQPPRTQVQGATVVGSTTPLTPPLPSYRPPDRPADGVPTGTRSRIVRGTETFMAEAPPAAAPTPGGDVSLNFTNAEVRDVAKAVLGDILGLTYAVDPAAEGQITIETARPISRDQVLSTFEVSLQAARLGLVREGNLYTVVPVGDAQRQTGLVGAGQAGFGTEAIALRYVSADELKKLLDPLIPTGAIVQTDPARNILFISGSSTDRRNLRDLAGQFDVDWLRGVSFALIVPQWTNSRNLVEQLTQLLNAEGVPTAGTVRFVPIQQVNGILAISTRAAYLDRVRSLVEMLDREAQGSRRRLFVYRVQNGRAADLAKVLTSAFGGESGKPSSSTPPPAGLANAGGQDIATPGAAVEDGSLPAPPAMPTIEGQSATGTSMTLDLGEAEEPIKITADETTNTIVVYAKPQQYEIIADALRRLDILPLQVMIESAVTEVTLNEELRYGVQWFFSTGNSSFSLSEIATGAVSQVFPGFSYLLTNGDTIAAVLNALSGITNINVVSAPKLLVLNNQTATLQVGDEVPIATQSAVSTDNPDAPIVNSIEYRNTGVILKITPRVNDNGVVLLDIAQEVSNVVETTTSDLDSPTIQQRRIASSVAVQDGQTIALGGLITENRQDGNSGIPVLKDIPFLGPLFGTTERKRDRTELLILLTPG